MAQYRTNVSYGLNQPLNTESPLPIISKRAPKTSDIGYAVGTIWVNTITNSVYILTSVTSNSANWNIQGGVGAFSTLSSTGSTTLATNGVTVNTLGSTNGATSVSILVGSGSFSLDGVGASTYNIGASTTTGTIIIGGTSQTGTLTIGGGDAAQLINIGNNVGDKTINIGTGAGDNLVTIGSTNTTSATDIQAGTGGIGLVAPFVALPGPVYIYTGAGAPGNGLALHAGDLYVNTTPTGATDRMFIATGAGTWTNFTMAA